MPPIRRLLNLGNNQRADGENFVLLVMIALATMFMLFFLIFLPNADAGWQGLPLDGGKILQAVKTGTWSPHPSLGVVVEAVQDGERLRFSLPVVEQGFKSCGGARLEHGRITIAEPSWVYVLEPAPLLLTNEPPAAPDCPEEC